MGVKGLWQLLEPTGRRTDCESLRGKRVAVDASIWLVQFIKAMRDEQGEMLENAHVRGFFRRACRLLHHGISPVFVFDGATPALKRRTTAVRRRLRETNAAKVRKTAEKVLLNALKQNALRAAARERKGEASTSGKELAVVDLSDPAHDTALVTTDDGDWERDWNSDQEYDDEEEEEEEEELDMFVPDGESIDPEVLSALPPSVRLEVIMKMRDKRMADNREHFARASGQMHDFSSLQLETYLKGTKLKRQIDAVMQRSDPDDPMMSKRIAAKDGREFIFAGPNSKHASTSKGVTLALPSASSSGMDALKTGFFANSSISGTSRRNRAPMALTAPQEQFLVTNLHPMLPMPSVAKSIAETPIVLNDAPSTLDLQISFSTGNLKAAAKDPLFADPDDITAVDDDDEWEDVDEAVPKPSPSPVKLAIAPPPAQVQAEDAVEVIHDDDDDDVDDDDGDDDDDNDGGAHGETALKRKNVYSLSHGFLKGRSLGGWDAEEEVLAPVEDPVDEGDVDAVIKMGLEAEQNAPAPIDADDENAQVQRAIEMSILDDTNVEVKTEEEKALEAAIALSLETEDAVAATKQEIIKEIPVVEDKVTTNIEDEPKEIACEPTPPPASTLEFEEATAEEEEWIAAANEAERAKERERIEQLIQEAEAQQVQLQQESRQAKQGAEEVTDEMYRQVQELLTLFGIPYIIAPQEAEAQCAYLNEHNLVDAVITDDSDVFLFGAKHVYRNFFAEAKYCEVYSSDRIKQELGLDRDRFIQLALLLGSDYTEGIHGVGIVNAIEIVSAFQGTVSEASEAFKTWVDLEELTMVPDKLLPNVVASQESPAKKSSNAMDENPIAVAFKDKHRSLKKAWDVPATFPSHEVIKAYQQPSVDQSKETFEWGKPDVDLLRLFCIKTFHWTRDAADQVLLPVLKSWSKRDAQRRIDSFFETTSTISGRVAKFRSSRVGKAVANLTSNGVLNPDLVLIRDPANALDEHIIVDYEDGDDDHGTGPSPQNNVVPTLDTENDDDAFLEFDLSQYSNPSPKKTPPPKSKPKPKAKPKAKAAPPARANPPRKRSKKS